MRKKMRKEARTTKLSKVFSAWRSRIVSERKQKIESSLKKTDQLLTLYKQRAKDDRAEKERLKAENGHLQKMNTEFLVDQQMKRAAHLKILDNVREINFQYVTQQQEMAKLKINLYRIHSVMVTSILCHPMRKYMDCQTPKDLNNYYNMVFSKTEMYLAYIHGMDPQKIKDEDMRQQLFDYSVVKDLNTNEIVEKSTDMVLQKENIDAEEFFKFILTTNIYDGTIKIVDDDESSDVVDAILEEFGMPDLKHGKIPSP